MHISQLVFLLSGNVCVYINDYPVGSRRRSSVAVSLHGVKYVKTRRRNAPFCQGAHSRHKKRKCCKALIHKINLSPHPELHPNKSAIKLNGKSGGNCGA